MRVIAFDPSLTATGWACFDDGVLVLCGIAGARTKLDDENLGKVASEVVDAFLDSNVPNSCGVAITEIPIVYQGFQGDPADLVAITFLAGALVAHVHALKWVCVKPRQWKQQVPKDIHNMRVVAKLSAAESKVLYSAKCTPSQRHNVIDAVGIGLHQLGRSA